jgi:hypothetical protein
MSQSSVDLITELHAQWMQTNQKSRALLQDIEERMAEARRVFHEERKAMEKQRDASLPKEDEEEQLAEDPRDPDYEEPVPYQEHVSHLALEPVFAHMYDHIPYEDEEPVPYEEPVPIVWGYDSEDDSDEEVDNEVELLNDDELLDIVW